MRGSPCGVIVGILLATCFLSTWLPGRHRAKVDHQWLAVQAFALVPGAQITRTSNGARAVLPRTIIETTVAGIGSPTDWYVRVTKDGVTLRFYGNRERNLSTFIRQIAWRESGQRGLGYGEVWKEYCQGLLPATMVYHSNKGEAITRDLGLLVRWGLNGSSSNDQHIEYIEWLIDEVVPGAARAAPKLFIQKMGEACDFITNYK